MQLGADGFLPEPPHFVDTNGGAKQKLRNTFCHCVATRATNQAARDYRKWFCEAQHS